MADHDDDATRIYRPYGSPPPDPAEEGSDDAAPPAAPDPFAPATPDAPAAADPFAPAPTADPFAPSPGPPAADPFAPPSPSPPAADPFAPPSGSGAPPVDPFAPSAADPFAPAPGASPPASDPFAPAAPPSGADPFAPSPDADPFRSPPAPAAADPFAPPASPPTADPFAPPAADPFAPAPGTPATASDPFAPLPGAPPGPDPFAPSKPPPAAPPSPFDATPGDPFAPAPAMPEVPAVPDRSADPFAATPTTSTEDPFAAYQGPALGGAAFDSGYHASPDARPEMDLPDAFGAEDTLAGAFTPVFSLILQIRASDTLGDPTAMRQRIEALLSEAAQRARSAGANDTDVAEATFCLVAFLDEAILSTEWPGHAAWSAQPLQLAHYDRYDAGERFFDRLKQLLDEGGTRKAMMEVYYLCLALGFKGRYAIHGRDVLRRLVDDLYGRLAVTPGKLAPRGTSREVAAEAEKGGIPTWALWAGAAALVLLLYLGLSLSLSSAATDTADDLRSLSTTQAE